MMIKILENFISIDEEKALLEEVESFPWRQDYIRLYGRRIALPRLQIWFGEFPYYYSGIRMDPLPLPNLLKTIKTRIEEKTKAPFNSCLGNLYRDGNDYVSKHSDNEPEIGIPQEDGSRIRIIASLSVGETRDFILSNKIDPKNKIKLSLKSRGLLIMRPPCQEEWNHELPKRKRVTEPRYNFTFRYTI